MRIRRDLTPHLDASERERQRAKESISLITVPADGDVRFHPALVLVVVDAGRALEQKPLERAESALSTRSPLASDAGLSERAPGAAHRL